MSLFNVEKTKCWYFDLYNDMYWTRPIFCCYIAFKIHVKPRLRYYIYSETCLRYIKGTRNYNLSFLKDGGNMSIYGFCDADLAFSRWEEYHWF